MNVMLSKFIALSQQPKKKSVTIILALIGAVTPLSGLHKFYVGQPWWGVIYLLMGWQSPIARIACAIDAVIYLAEDEQQFNHRFNFVGTENDNSALKANPEEVKAIASALRELEKLRQEGLISEYEFEQKRRKLIL